MKSIFNSLAVFAVFVCVAAAAVPAAGQWIENGIPICAATGDQQYHSLVEVEPGVIVIVWSDYRGSGWDIYAQRIHMIGYQYWAADGLPVCTEAGGQLYPVAVSDGAGGVIIAWWDTRAGNGDIYAQRLDIDGARLWARAGVPICVYTGEQVMVDAVSDGDGGAIITWSDARYGQSNWDVYAQRIDGSGSPQWTTHGVSICDALATQGNSKIIMAGAGGAIIAWEDQRLGTYDIYAQRVDHDGYYQWTLNGEIVTNAVEDQFNIKIISDGYDGAILAWTDFRNGIPYDIYAQRMGQDGAALWTTDGEAVCTASSNQDLDAILMDGNDGAIITWSDARNVYDEVYAQRLNRNGIPMWTANGVCVTAGDGDQWASGAVSDGAGGAVVGILDTRSGDCGVYAQRIEGTMGAAYWYDHVPLCDYTEHQSSTELISDGSGGAIGVWWDYRNGADIDLYAQRIDRNGFWGYPCPWIFGVSDAPNDQGGYVIIDWERSRLDSYAERGIQYYSIWRLLIGEVMQALIDAGVEETSPAEIGPDFEGEAYRFVSLEGAMYGFEWIVNLEAHYMDYYSYTAPTLYDSTAACPALHAFIVSAHLNGSPLVFWDSIDFWGYSVDNLAPCAPLALVGEQSYVPEGLELSWTPNTEADFGGYNIYRDVGESFEPGPGSLLATTCDTMTFDGGWTWDSGYCYKIAAVDIHGNESGYAVLCAGEITGDDPMPVPDVTFLAQNYPNPFNPNTTIAFGLKTGGFVNLSIYNAAGKLVAVLINESRPAGPYATVWNGKDKNGSSAASGVYFYRLITKEFEETKKMILLR